jgi:hypothetical protein
MITDINYKIYQCTCTELQLVWGFLILLYVGCPFFFFFFWLGFIRGTIFCDSLPQRLYQQTLKQIRISLLLFVLLIYKFISRRSAAQILGCQMVKKKRKCYPCKGPRRPKGSWDVDGLPYFLDNRLADGGEVSLTQRTPFTPQEDSWGHFY